MVSRESKRTRFERNPAGPFNNVFLCLFAFDIFIDNRVARADTYLHYARYYRAKSIKGYITPVHDLWNCAQQTRL